MAAADGGAAAADDLDGGGGAASGVGGDPTPTGARTHAEKREQERVTLYRALRTCCTLLTERGFTISRVGGAAVPPGSSAHALVRAFISPERVSRAEERHEVVLEGVVPHEPIRFTTAWAQNLAPGTKLVVITLGKGKVEAVRQVAEALPVLGAARAILLSAVSLTPQARKGLAAANLQHFQYSELQRAVTAHMWVPRHVPLNQAMDRNVRRRFGETAKLYSMWTTDRVARFLGFLPGQCVAVREILGRDQPVVNFYRVEENYANLAGHR